VLLLPARSPGDLPDGFTRYSTGIQELSAAFFLTFVPMLLNFLAPLF
jgi:hypothetical protein